MSNEKVDYKEILAPGFIEDTVEEMIERIPILNKYVAIATVESMLSTCSFNIKTRNKASSLPLTTWYLIILPSGDWKTVPIKKWDMKILEKVEENIGRQKRLMLSRFSDEGLIKHLTWHSIEVYNEETGENEKFSTIGNDGVIIRDEYTGMMKGIRKKDYMAESMELLSEIYDGIVGRRATVKHGEQSVFSCCMSFLAATTPYIYTFPIGVDILQGGMNRMNPITFIDEENDEELPPEFFDADDNENIKDNIANKLTKLINLPSLKMIVPDDECRDRWIAYELKYRLLKRKCGILNPIRGFYARQAEKVLKYSPLYYLSRNFDRLVAAGGSTGSLLTYEIEDMERAIKTQEFYLKNFKKMLVDWKAMPKDSGKLSSDRGIRESAVALIKQYKLISRHKLADELGVNINNQKFTETLSSLLSERKIKQTGGGTDEDKEKSRQLIASADKQWLKNQLVSSKPRGNPPLFYELVGE